MAVNTAQFPDSDSDYVDQKSKSTANTAKTKSKPKEKSSSAPTSAKRKRNVSGVLSSPPGTLARTKKSRAHKGDDQTIVKIESSQGSPSVPHSCSAISQPYGFSQDVCHGPLFNAWPGGNLGNYGNNSVESNPYLTHFSTQSFPNQDYTGGFSPPPGLTSAPPASNFNIYEDVGALWETVEQDDNRCRTAAEAEYTRTSDEDPEYDNDPKTKKTKKSGQPRKKRDPRPKLLKWTDNDWKLACLGIVYACGEAAIPIPFDRAASVINPNCTASALQQALLKLKSKQEELGHHIPNLKMSWTRKAGSAVNPLPPFKTSGKQVKMTDQSVQVNICTLKTVTFDQGCTVPETEDAYAASSIPMSKIISTPPLSPADKRSEAQSTASPLKDYENVPTGSAGKAQADLATLQNLTRSSTATLGAHASTKYPSRPASQIATSVHRSGCQISEVAGYVHSPTSSRIAGVLAVSSSVQTPTASDFVRSHTPSSSQSPTYSSPVQQPTASASVQNSAVSGSARHHAVTSSDVIQSSQPRNHTRPDTRIPAHEAPSSNIMALASTSMPTFNSSNFDASDLFNQSTLAFESQFGECNQNMQTGLPHFDLVSDFGMNNFQSSNSLGYSDDTLFNDAFNDMHTNGYGSSGMFGLSANHDTEAGGIVDHGFSFSQTDGTAELSDSYRSFSYCHIEGSADPFSIDQRFNYSQMDGILDLGHHHVKFSPTEITFKVFEDEGNSPIRTFEVGQPLTQEFSPLGDTENMPPPGSSQGADMDTDCSSDYDPINETEKARN
ncbi:hypothetical protein CC78DRAFT_580988 [Lojkania enalia]|uniref:Uncharacterized protein n=1 Tax=Lojkania enalia TaxID=147567 RepID=A0A9P4K775_9PLEO|nr:hypothetical protein CC78DRAFT_580988 [Didymosphaeria enalia]